MQPTPCLAGIMPSYEPGGLFARQAPSDPANPFTMAPLWIKRQRVLPRALHRPAPALFVHAPRGFRPGPQLMVIFDRDRLSAGVMATSGLLEDDRIHVLAA